LIVVLTTVDFHNQPSLGTQKISNEVSDLVLAAKLVSTDLPRPQSIPQFFLNVCLVSS